MKKSLDCSRGAIVEFDGRRFRVTNDAVSFSEVQARDLESGRTQLLRIADLQLPSEERPAVDDAPDLTTVDEPVFREAVRRKAVIDQFLELPRRTRDDAKRAAIDLGTSTATFYRWLRAYREDDRATTLAPKKRPGGRGQSRLTKKQEELTQLAITKHHLTPRQRRVRATFKFLERLCRKENVDVPHENTLRARIKALDPEIYLRARGQSKLARERFTPHPGHYDEATGPLSVVQIDHTELDVMLVDEQHRLPLRCPFLTVVFDVYSRMVLGFYVSFDSPGMLGTGLALYRAIAGKEKWLASMGVEEQWPCWGFPVKVHVDNAKEFRGEVLRRACEQYGMSITFRALKKPEFGGHIERWLGTFNEEIHELPGKRLKREIKGDHDLEKDAAYTLRELEYHIAVYIAGVYNQQLHSQIGCSPLQRWTDAILGDGKTPGIGLPRRPTNEERLRIDLMPLEERTIQPYGVQVNEIRYYDDALRRYIGRTPVKLQSFRYDPRDIHSIYFWDPELNKYAEIAYADVRRPPTSIWEIREVRRHLRAEGRKKVNEDLIFTTLEKLRKHQETAEATTKQVRKKHERANALARQPKPSLTPARPVPATREQSEPVGRPTLTLVPPRTPRRFGRIEPLEVDKL
jgi:putative transposase